MFSLQGTVSWNDIDTSLSSKYVRALNETSGPGERIRQIESECARHRLKYAHGKINLKKWADVPILDRPRIFVSDKYKVTAVITHTVRGVARVRVGVEIELTSFA